MSRHSNVLWVYILALVLPIPTLGQSSNVGVLASTLGCPPQTQGPFTVHIDNEDNNNANNRGGWLGASISNRNTTLKICSVDSSLFTSASQPYMLVSLWSSCPPGTTRITRQVDSEDNNPTSSSDIPGVIGTYKDVILSFCLFPASGQSSASFPALGWDYGVFAAPGFPQALQTGFLYMDDQDIPWWATVSDANRNRWCEGNSCSGYGENRNFFDILSGGLNTYMSLARISGAVCNNGICSAGESCSTCPTDCGACPVCGDLLCTGGESCSTCSNDCGQCAICGDGICSAAESCWSCCNDCGVCNLGEICPTLQEPF
ncbi:MAG TPA: hypothetical protein VF789_13025 [Thermoanaerobaculia bacterium]